MTGPARVERTTTYATVVGELPAAWTFVMEHVDTVGTSPEVRIRPLWTNDLREFEVTVSGTTEERRDDD